MRHWLRSLRRALGGRPSPRRLVSSRLALEPLEERSLLAAGFLQTNMVSDIPGLANVTDKNLINPWGLTPTGEFWVSDNNSGVSTLYDGIGTPNPLVVTIPPIAGSPAGTLGQPSGIVNNPFTSNTPPKQEAFDIAPNEPAIFIFDSQDGVISAWSFKLADDTKAVVEVNKPGADYTGLAISSTGSTPRLFAANFSAGTIDVFDGSFKPVTLAAGAFQDPNLPQGKGYAPFNIQNIGGKLYVEYAQFDATTGEGKLNGGGFVDVFNGDGVLQQRLIKGTEARPLVSPWGVTLAPANFGQFSNDLLVGNFGNGWINAYDKSGHFVGTITDASGKPFREDHLWAVNAGTGTNGQNANAIYFTAGIQNEAHGLFGSLQAIPPLASNAPVLPSLPGGAVQTFSTVPANGDQNPYGLAFVPADFKGTGVLHAGDLLVSNFNNKGTADNPGGTQGTGTTIVRITPNGGTSVFFQGAAGLGLTTALGVLKNGFVVVGSVPTTQGTAATIQPGSLLVLDANGKVVLTLSGNLLDSPWDLTVNDEGDFAQVFVSNVVSGTITRISLDVPKNGTPVLEGEQLIGSGYKSQANDAALILGPTGLAYDPERDVLYVASTADNTVSAIPHASSRQRNFGTGKTVVKDSHLRGPLGLVLAPNGDLIVANGDAVNPDATGKQNSELVEFTPQGKFVAQFQVDAAAGSAFGLALASDNGQLRFAAVDDATNTVSIWTFATPHAESNHQQWGGWGW